MILAGDLGGTKTLLEIGAVHQRRWTPSFSRRYEAKDHSTFDRVLQEFLREWEQHRQAGRGIFTATPAWAQAGPTFHDRTEMTNVPWVVDGKGAQRANCGFRTCAWSTIFTARGERHRHARSSRSRGVATGRSFCVARRGW